MLLLNAARLTLHGRAGTDNSETSVTRGAYNCPLFKCFSRRARRPAAAARVKPMMLLAARSKY